MDAKLMNVTKEIQGTRKLEELNGILYSFIGV